MILAGTDAYTGDTNVTAGTLLVNGSLTGSIVNVVAGKLGGTGSITKDVIIGDGLGTADSFLAPGASIGDLSVAGPVTLKSDAVFQLEINTSSLTTDSLVTAGAFTLQSGATLNVQDLGSALLSSSAPFTFITATQGVTGTFAGMPDGFAFAVGANTFAIDYDANTVSIVAVPEPSAVVTLLGGLASLVSLGRFRQRRSSKP